MDFMIEISGLKYSLVDKKSFIGKHVYQSAFCMFLSMIAVANPLLAKIDCSKITEKAHVIDTDVCPGEGCQLGEWTAEEKIPVLDKVDGKEISSIAKGEKFKAVYGENHVEPVKIEVLKSPSKGDVSDAALLKVKWNKGDSFLLLTNMGEAWFKACLKTKELIDVECTGIQNMEDTCKPDPKGTWAKSLSGTGPKETWWVKVKFANHKEGWIQGHRYLVLGSDRFE
jgi:hypothetical protein